MDLSLKFSILAAGWTQRQISGLTGIPETRLSDLARGRSRPTPEEKDALARVLGRPTPCPQTCAPAVPSSDATA